ncbi:MAG: hypothetical protein ACLVEX_06535 [Ruthenibacterium lactatiformans]
MQTSKTLARLYCPNPKDPTEGLRQKANGVWERNEVIDGKRKSFSSRDPIEAWRKRSEYIITREEPGRKNSFWKNSARSLRTWPSVTGHRCWK